MYTPDRSIVRQLKECDPDLNAVWDSDSGHWWVTCMGKPTIKVREPDGSYRPLDGRIVTRMREEAWVYRNKYGRLHMHDKQVFEQGQEAQRRRRAAQRDDFRQYAIEEIHPRVVGVGGASGRNSFAGFSVNT